MPRLSVLYIRAALIYLMLGFTFGAAMLWHKGVPLHPMIWRLLPAHIEFLLIGWTVQLVFGVAFWILPRFYTNRGETRPAWLAFYLLNVGIWMVGVAPALGLQGIVPLLGRVAELGAAIAFALHAWPRIKPPGA